MRPMEGRNVNYIRKEPIMANITPNPFSKRFQKFMFYHSPEWAVRAKALIALQHQGAIMPSIRAYH
jgi:hypothetical protein